MIFLKPVFAHAPCSHRLCPILVSILSLSLRNNLCCIFCDFSFLHILFTLGLCVYAILSFAIFAIPWAIVRLHPHWKREINASCYSFRSRLNFSLSLNLLFASFFCHRVTTIFSVSARMLSFLKMHSKFFVDICVAFAHHLSFMCTISFAYRVFRSNSKRKRNKNINSQRAKSFVSFFYIPSPAIPLSRFYISFSCSHHSLKYVSSLAPCLATYPFAFSTIYTFQFHFISRTRFLSFDLFLRSVAFALASCCCCLSHSRQLNEYGVYVLILHLLQLYMLHSRVCILSLMLFKCFSCIRIRFFFSISTFVVDFSFSFCL